MFLIEQRAGRPLPRAQLRPRARRAHAGAVSTSASPTWRWRASPSPVPCRPPRRGSTRCTARPRARSCTRSTPRASRCASTCPRPRAPAPPRRASGASSSPPTTATLYAANPALGLVVEIAARDAAGVRRTAPHPPRRDRRAAAAGRRPRRRHPVRPERAAAWSPSPPRPCRRAPRCCAAIASAPCSRGGRRLFVQDGAVATLDAASGAVLARTATSAPAATLAAVVPAR